MREQHPARGRAALPDRQRQGVLVGRGARGHGEHGTRRGGIPPRAVVEAGEPRARRLEEAPRAVGVLDEEPDAVGALEAEVGAATRHDGVASDVPAGDLRVEGAGHPDRRRERARVGREGVAGAEQVPVRAQDRELLGGRDELAAADGPRELGAVVGRLDVGAVVEQAGVVELGAVEGPRREGRGWTTTASQGSRRRLCRATRPSPAPRGRGRRRPPAPTGSEWRPVRRRPSGRRRRTWPRDGPRGRCPRSRCGGCRPGAMIGRGVLQGDERVLVLEARARQRRRRRARARPRRAPVRSDELEGVGRPAGARADRADHEPRHALAGHVLADGDRGAVVGRRDRGDVEVLADVVLVDADVAEGREGGVVGQRPRRP